MKKVLITVCLAAMSIVNAFACEEVENKFCFNAEELISCEYDLLANESSVDKQIDNNESQDFFNTY